MTTSSLEHACSPQEKAARTSNRPWYREPWPWILMAGLAAVIIAGLVTAWLAVRSYDGLIADDYYKQGLAVNQVLARARMAERLGIHGTLELVPDAAGLLQLRLFSASGIFPESIDLALSHPTRSGLDQRVRSMVMVNPGVYAASIQPLAPGRWNLIVEDGRGQWRIRGELAVPGGREATLRPRH